MGCISATYDENLWNSRWAIERTLPKIRTIHVSDVTLTFDL